MLISSVWVRSRMMEKSHHEDCFPRRGKVFVKDVATYPDNFGRRTGE